MMKHSWTVGTAYAGMISLLLLAMFIASACSSREATPDGWSREWARETAEAKSANARATREARGPTPTIRPTSTPCDYGCQQREEELADIGRDLYLKAQIEALYDEEQAIREEMQANQAYYEKAYRELGEDLGYFPETTEGQPNTGCEIKGNVSVDTGEKIYHVPGQEYYDETVIDTTYGERWFCTEQDAVEAGWRKALR